MQIVSSLTLTLRDPPKKILVRLTEINTLTWKTNKSLGCELTTFNHIYLALMGLPLVDLPMSLLNED